MTGPCRFYGWVSSAGSSSGRLSSLDPAIKTRSRDSQQLGGSRFVPAGLCTGGLDQPPFDFCQQFIERLDGFGGVGEGYAAALVAANGCGQVFDSYQEIPLLNGRGLIHDCERVRAGFPASRRPST